MTDAQITSALAFSDWLAAQLRKERHACHFKNYAAVVEHCAALKRPLHLSAPELARWELGGARVLPPQFIVLRLLRDGYQASPNLIAEVERRYRRLSLTDLQEAS